MCREGVIKFELEHASETLRGPQADSAIASLKGWRKLLFRCGLVGRDPARYDGAGFGNISHRVGAPSSPRGKRAMVITGSQTGGIEDLDADHYCVVSEYDLARNRVVSAGPVPPSSETLTHGAIYDLSPSVRAVLHVHDPALWRRAAELRLPRTRAEVAYGTQDMAYEVQRLYRETQLSEVRVLSMDGHEDGVIALGRSAEEAGESLMRALARAL